MKTYKRIYNLVKKIPKGKVATYGQIGQMLDLSSRVVGWALNRLARYKKQRNSHWFIGSLAHWHKIPWHRVINSKGKISTDRVLNIPLGLQKKLLEQEGVRFDRNNKTDLRKYRYPCRGRL